MFGTNWLRIFLTFGTLAVVVESASAADVYFRDDNPSRGNITDMPHIEIRGDITAGDSAKLERLIPLATQRAVGSSMFQNAKIDPEKRPLVILDSDGGIVNEAIRMGRILRAHHAWTVVPLFATCASSCVLVLVGGVTRNVFGYDRPVPDQFGLVNPIPEGASEIKIGLHRPTFPAQDFAKLSPNAADRQYDKGIRAVQKYLEEMRMPPALFDSIMKVPSENIAWLTVEESRVLRLSGEDSAYGEWYHAQLEIYCGKNWSIVNDEGRACVSSASSRDQVDFCLNVKRGKMYGIKSPCNQ